MAESAAYARRTFLGGAAQARIPAGVNAGATTATADDLSTWVGATANGPTRAMLDIDGANPEEVEISGISGNDITFSARGLRGTDDSSHDANVTIDLIHSPRDDDEANYTATETVGKATAANQLLVSDGANSFAALAVAASRFVGRKASGDVAAMTAAEALTVLGVSSFIQTLLDDADAAAARTTLGVSATAFSGCRVTKSAAQGINTGTETTLSFNGETYDVGGWHDNATNNSRITVPSGKDGYVAVSGRAVFRDTAGTDGYRNIFVYKNGVAYGAATASAVGGTYSGVEINERVPVVAGDYLELKVTHNLGVSLDVLESSSGTIFQCHFIGT